MTGTAQNWAMLVMQALDKGCHHDLLISYNAFREAVIGVFGDIDWRGNAKDRLGRPPANRVHGHLYFYV